MVKKQIKIVPDTSIIIEGKLSDLIEKGKIDQATIIIPEFVINELENQANKKREIGYLGLAEITNIRKQAKKRKITIAFQGRLPTQEEIGMARSGRIDALIRNVAAEEDAILFTGDRVQSLVAEAKGIRHEYYPPEKEVSFSLLNFFKKDISSVHLKTGVPPMAKCGKPGSVELKVIGKKALNRKEIEKIAKETLEKAKLSEFGFIEMSKQGATVLQIEDLRVVITLPPFSEVMEITAVRPIKYLELSDYKLTDKLMSRLNRKAEGILIAGAPGQGKSTFAQALAKHYSERGKIVKTLEQPRDLQLPKAITQYAPLEGNIENNTDVLLLVRPDFTIFDEVRRLKEFQVFADLRLAGVGMVGVVHASEALDAIQRLIGKVELGVIPQVVDTVIFIESGAVSKVYDLELVVKCPEGMTQDDLARPVIVVREFETRKNVYEIYTYGEETIVMPVSGTEATSRVQEYATEKIRELLSKYDHDPQIRFTGPNSIVWEVEERNAGKLIGREGKRIKHIEDEIGVSITIETRESKGTDIQIIEKGKSLVLLVDPALRNREVEILDGEDLIAIALVRKKGEIPLRGKAATAKRIIQAYSRETLRIVASPRN